MALTRKMLKAMGIEDDKIDEIIAAHTEVTDQLKAERDRFRADADKLPGVQAELDGLKAEAAKNGGKNPFEVKYNALKEEFDQFKSDLSAKETAAKKAEAYRKLLRDAGISEKRIEAVLRVSDLESVKLGEDGQIEGAEELRKSVQAEWGDFIETTGRKGAETPNPPKDDGSGGDYESMSDEDYYKATYEASKKG